LPLTNALTYPPQPLHNLKHLGFQYQRAVTTHVTKHKT